MPERKPSHKTVLDRLGRFVASVNIAEELDEQELTAIGTTVCEEFDLDERSRDEWEQSARKAMDAALQVREPKNYPFPGASNVKWPLITVASLQFNARAYPALVDGVDVVKARVVGNDNGVPLVDPNTGQQAVQVAQDPQTGEQIQIPQWQLEPGAKRERASRISQHMSYQVLEEMEEWEEDTDSLLMSAPIVGCAFRKVFRDEKLRRNRSCMVSAFDFVVNQNTIDLETTPRATHRFERYPYEVEENFRAGIWSEIDIGEPPDADGDPDAPHTFLEQHRYWDLDGDGLDEPYIVTVHQETTKVVRIVANYNLESIEENEKGTKVARVAKGGDVTFIKYPFIPDPKGGFYGIGFGHLLESLGGAIDTVINQMLDAGHLQNAGGGFIGSGLRLKKGLLRMEPGVYKTVNAAGSKIREAIYNMEHPGPSAVLFQMLGLMIESAKDITATKDILTGESPREQTATTTLALIEQGLKTFTVIYKRLYRAFKKEFRALFRLNALHLQDEEYFTVLDDPQAIRREDYNEDDFNVIPQADPRMVTDMQRLARAQLLMELREDPMLNQIEIRRRFFQAANFEDIDSLIQPPQPDPMAQAQLQAVQADTAVKGATVKKMESEVFKNLAGVEQADENTAIDIAKEEARLEMEAKKIEVKQRSNSEAA